MSQVQPKWAEMSADRIRAELKAAELPAEQLTLKWYKGLGHGAEPSELRDCITFLRRVLPPAADRSDL